MVTTGPYQGADIWEYTDSLSLARATVNAGESETFENRVNFLKSFKQAVVDRATYQELSAQMKAGPGKFWITEDGEIEFLDMVDKDTSYLESIKERITMSLVNEGISPLLYWGNPTTPEELALMREEKVGLFNKDLEVWRTVEKALWESVFDMARDFGMLPEDSKQWRVAVKFREPITNTDPREKYELFETRERLGVGNVLELIQDENDHVASTAQAMGQFTKNTRIRAARANVSRALQVKNENGPSAEETLEKVKGQLTGPEGAPGPSMITEKQATGRNWSSQNDN